VNVFPIVIRAGYACEFMFLFRGWTLGRFLEVNVVATIILAGYRCEFVFLFRA
jgi:hypothetical protein